METAIKTLNDKCEKYNDPDKYFIKGDILGSGKFGSVYKATPTVEGTELLIKKNGPVEIPSTLAIKNLSISPSKIDDFINEMDVMIKLKDIEHIGKTYGCMYQQSDLDDTLYGSLIMELVSGISLQSYIHQIRTLAGPRSIITASNKNVILDSAIKFCYDLLQTIKTIHSAGVYHNDLHDGNVMVTLADNKSINNFKIIDFGKMSAHNDDNADFNMTGHFIFSLLALIALKYGRLSGIAVISIPVGITLESAYILDECICINVGTDLKLTNRMYSEIYSYYSGGR